MTDSRPDPDEAYVGHGIKVCHATGRVTDANLQSYTIEVELGGVVQHIVATTSYVHDRIDLK